MKQPAQLTKEQNQLIMDFLGWKVEEFPFEYSKPLIHYRFVRRDEENKIIDTYSYECGVVAKDDLMSFEDWENVMQIWGIVYQRLNDYKLGFSYVLQGQIFIQDIHQLFCPPNKEKILLKLIEAIRFINEKSTIDQR